jgi:ribonuclease Z
MTTCDFRVTPLGTGMPIPSPDRWGPCTPVEAGDQTFLIGEQSASARFEHSENR